MNKIEGCPFCGSEDAKLHRDFDYVVCQTCGARGSYFDGHPTDAINAWNRVAKKGGFSMTLNSPLHKQKRTIVDGTKGMQRGD